MTEVADQFGVGFQRDSTLFKKYGYPIERGGPRVHRSMRVLHMYSLYERGLTLREVGERFGVTEARVWQLFNEAGFGRRQAQRPSSGLMPPP